MPKLLHSNPHTSHGIRVENMFGFMATALGEIKFIKQEDVGLIYPSEEFAIPDYRVTLKNDKKYLIEVKNYNKTNNNLRLKKQYIDKMTKYAFLESIELRFAIYWSRIGMWTLVSLDHFNELENHFSISFIDAIINNEMHILGDAMLAIEPPIKFELEVDTNDTQGIEKPDSEIFLLEYVIKSVSAYVMDKKITTPRDTQFIVDIVFFGLNGAWEETNYFISTSNKTGKIVFEYTPENDFKENNQRFFIATSLSRLCTGKYNAMTTTDGEISKLSVPYNDQMLSSFFPIYPRDDFPLLVLTKNLKVEVNDSVNQINVSKT